MFVSCRNLINFKIFSRVFLVKLNQARFSNVLSLGLINATLATRVITPSIGRKLATVRCRVRLYAQTNSEVLSASDFSYLNMGQFVDQSRIGDPLNKRSFTQISSKGSHTKLTFSVGTHNKKLACFCNQSRVVASAGNLGYSLRKS